VNHGVLKKRKKGGKGKERDLFKGGDILAYEARKQAQEKGMDYRENP